MTEATASNNRKTAAHYLVGIDLGTTHTVVAFADVNEPLSADSRGIFHIEQLVAPGEVAKRPMLPSFRYHPVAGEISAHDMLLPWSSEEGETGKGSTNTESASTDATHLAGEIPEVVIGEWARELGSKVEGRLVSSAKSWLSHPHTDRQADILPWAAAEGVHKVSPVFASASYLHYLRCAWNHQHPHARLEHQEIVITIPASFDEGARALTVAAAKQAGLDNILLIEEPQAVCYDWYARHQRDAETSLKDIRLLLVCDVGGGTTDLSLIKITSNKNGLTLDRIGVGDHLMLGGDNIDLALAHIVEQRLAGNKKLSAAQLSQLSQQTCQAKERLLSADGPCQAKVTLLGSGSRLIGNAKSCLLQREEVYQLAIDGFFPLSDFAALPDKKRSAVVAFGLPYARDPAISKHLAAFITQHREACTQALQPDSQTSVNGAPAKAIPDALLLNGGVFNSAAVRQRTLDLFRHWGSQNTKLLDNHHPEHAVAYGAVAYLMARRGSGLKIGGGSARSFFLMLENSENTPAEQSNNESSPTVKSGLCLLPKGSEPGAEVALTEHTFLLTVGQPVKFKVASCTGDNPYGAGDRADIDTAFVQLPPLITALRDDTEQPPINIANATENTQIKVSLHAVLTEVGTLQIDCIEVENKTAEARRWQLEFEVRHKRLQTNKAALKATPDSSNAPAIPTSLPVNFAAAAEKIEAMYGSKKLNLTDAQIKKNLKSLRTDLEQLLGKRDEWGVGVARALLDELLQHKTRRRRTQLHERTWYNLAGFCLRPGTGDPADGWRIEKLWPLYAHALHFTKETQSWSDWWTFWRRAAGGLNQQQQEQVYSDVINYIDTDKLGSRKIQADAKLKSYEAMVRLLASLERLPITNKITLCENLLTRLKKPSEPKASWWALGRVASRLPFYGSAHAIIPADIIEPWLNSIIQREWKEAPAIAFSATMMARMCGDRSHDINDDLRDNIIEKLGAAKMPQTWVAMLHEVTLLDSVQTQQIFGEALPPGLILVDE